MPELQERTILVTGAGAGLGAALARGAAAAGAEAVLLGRTVRKLERVYDEIVAAGGREPAIYPLDLEGAGEEDYAELAQRVEQQCGRLDGLVHNAAILGPQTPIEQLSGLEWARVLQVNLTAPMLLTRSLLPLLRRSGDAGIVFLGEHGDRAYRAGYGVSKAGVRSLAAILAEELEAEGRVRVAHCDPGPLRTGLRASAFPGALAEESRAPEEAVAGILALLGAPPAR